MTKTQPDAAYAPHHTDWRGYLRHVAGIAPSTVALFISYVAILSLIAIRPSWQVFGALVFGWGFQLRGHKLEAATGLFQTSKEFSIRVRR